jgi:hypothetical protein
MFYLIPILVGILFSLPDWYWLAMPFFYVGIFIIGLMMD